MLQGRRQREREQSNVSQALPAPRSDRADASHAE
jgi:hypothetical protein